MKLKKLVALVLATAMVMGSCISVFASDTGSATQEGAGTSEGHVEKNVMDFVLPTTTASTFAYIMDPERLITATEGAKHGEATFPAAEGDTGVYFLTDTNTYSNTSNTVKAVNKGSTDATLTVKVKTVATTGGKDIALATAALTSSDNSAEAAKLYLAASVGGKSEILSATDATVNVIVPGNAANYETVYKTGENAGYVFQKKSTGLTAWKAVDINLTGAVTKGIAVASDTTAPTVSFTWSFAKKGTDDTTTSGAATTDFTDAAAPSATATQAVLEEGKTAAITVNLGVGTLAATGVTSFTNVFHGNDWIAVGAASYSNGVITITDIPSVNDILGASESTKRQFTIKFNDTAKTEVTVTLTAKN